MAVTRTKLGKVIPGTATRSIGPNPPVDFGPLGEDFYGAFESSRFVTPGTTRNTTPQPPVSGGYLDPAERMRLEQGRSPYYAANPFAVPGVTPESEISDFDLTLDWGGGQLGGGGGGGSASAFLNAQTAAAKFAAEQQAARDALTRQTTGARTQEAYLRSMLDMLGQGTSAITGTIDEQERAGRQYIEDTAANLLSQLEQRQAQGETLTRTGYSNLMNYLAANQPTAFAQAQRAMPTITESALGRYMTGQGVSPAAAQEAATLANIQAAGGAANYNQLLNVLAAREQAAQGSRQSEAEMGLTSQLAALQAIYGRGTAGLEQQKLSALQELLSGISNARIQAQRDVTAREQEIQGALAALYGTGLVQPPTDTTGGAAAAAEALTRAQRLGTAGQEFTNFRQAIQALNPRAVAALSADGSLSRADIEELKRRNPKLATQFR